MRSSRLFKEAEATPPDRLLVVLDQACLDKNRRDLSNLAREIITAGTRRLWYRNYVDPPDLTYRRTKMLVEMLAGVGGMLLTGDRADIALASNAQGVHLPARGLPVSAARRVLPGGIIGRSCHTLQQVRRTCDEAADYLTLSPIFPTISEKRRPRPPLGLDILRQIAAIATIPVYALGGIDSTKVENCLRTGVFGIAVLGAICQTPDPGQAVTELLGTITATARKDG